MLSPQRGLFDDPASAEVCGRGATLSRCLRYRYELVRTWAPGAPSCAWIMLNPSTASAVEDDPTIRRCIAFARSWGCGSIVVVNLFAWRATDPAALRGVADPIGPENDGFILANLRPAKLRIAAWGAAPLARERAREVLERLRRRRLAVHHLGLTQDGSPTHPLARGAHRIPSDQRPVLWEASC